MNISIFDIHGEYGDLHSKRMTDYSQNIKISIFYIMQNMDIQRVQYLTYRKLKLGYST